MGLENALFDVSVSDFLEKEAFDLAEYFNGEVVLMSAVVPAHGLVVGRLFRIFGEKLCDGCAVLGEPVRVKLFDGENIFVMPDVFVVCRKGKARIFSRWVEGAPDLAVEVLSSSSVWNDRSRKMKLYQEAGVREYWIVDLAEKFLDVFVLDGAGLYQAHKFGDGDRVGVGMFRGVQVGEIFADLNLME
jgi:Uma2 family endonuclease